MGYIAQSDLVANMTPEQKILVQQFYSKYDYDPTVGSHKKIVNIEPLYFNGQITGSEFKTLSLNKMYICLSISATGLTGVTGTDEFLRFYNEAGVGIHALSNRTILYNAAGFFDYETVYETDIYFAYLDNPGFVYYYMKFIGYRVTLN